MKLNELIRPNILALKPYSCARDEYDGPEAIFLDANESPYENGLNRYPDPRHRALREHIGWQRGVGVENIVLGNGSDEIIDLLIRSTCRPGVDSIVVFSPGYSMYEVSAAVNDVAVQRFDLTADLQPDVEALASAKGAKLAFICSPNNPVGNVVPHATIRDICRVFDGLVVVDEAYIDFADAPSAVELVGGLNNLFVMQTLSKSWGMAGLRIGVGIGASELIAVLDKVKAPYNIGGPAQQMALCQLADTESFTAHIAEIRSERERLREEFDRLGVFDRVYPSQANFLLVATPRFAELYVWLAGNGVVVRQRDIPPLIPRCLRISVGTPAENDRLIKLLEQWKKN